MVICYSTPFNCFLHCSILPVIFHKNDRLSINFFKTSHPLSLTPSSVDIYFFARSFFICHAGHAADVKNQKCSDNWNFLNANLFKENICCIYILQREVRRQYNVLIEDDEENQWNLDETGFVLLSNLFFMPFIIVNYLSFNNFLFWYMRLF